MRSNQEELTYLKIPTLLMRKATERPEGLDGNITLSNYSSTITDRFLTSIKKSHKIEIDVITPTPSPTKLIIDTLEQYTH